MSSKKELTEKELEQIRSSAKSTLYVSVAVTLVWLFVYNIVAHDSHPLLAFFKVLDGINDLVIGMLSVIGIGIAIVTVFTITNFFTQTISSNTTKRNILKKKKQDKNRSKQEMPNKYQKTVDLAYAIDQWRIFPRIFISTYIYLLYKVVMWYMAIITISPLSMRTMHPTVINRCHYMAIHTSFWLVRHVGDQFCFFSHKES